MVPLGRYKCLDYIARMIAEEMILPCEKPVNHEGTTDFCGECLSCAISMLLMQAGYIDNVMEVAYLPNFD